MILRSARVPAAEFARVSGWELTAEGLCRGDRCVPFAGTSRAAVVVADAARALGMPLVQDRGLWALGPEAGGKALDTAVLPEIELPDVEGRPFRLSSLRGSKMLLVAWASW